MLHIFIIKGKKLYPKKRKEHIKRSFIDSKQNHGYRYAMYKVFKNINTIHSLITRSLLKQSNILLLDEATSSVDNITQKNIQTAIEKINRNTTILIIAHRLSTVINCDRIIVIDEGKIIDTGTHSELLKSCPKYQELYKYEKKTK